MQESDKRHFVLILGMYNIGVVSQEILLTREGEISSFFVSNHIFYLDEISSVTILLKCIFTLTEALSNQNIVCLKKKKARRNLE